MGIPEWIIANVAANKISKETDEKIQEDILGEYLQDIKRALGNIVDFYKNTREKPIDNIITIPVDPGRVTLRMLGRRHSFMFCPSSINLTFSIPGMGNIAFSPGAGWNQIDMPDGTQVYMTSGSATSILYRLTNDGIGALAL